MLKTRIKKLARCPETDRYESDVWIDQFSTIHEGFEFLPNKEKSTDDNSTLNTIVPQQQTTSMHTRIPH